MKIFSQFDGRQATGAQSSRLRMRCKRDARAPVMKRLFKSLLIAVLCLAATQVLAQKRDDLTDAETDLIRFHQEIDKRVEIFIKAADRRFAIINGAAQPSTKKLMKDEPDWGELPKGSHAELLSDIAGILDEAITNIDDVSRRDEKNPLVSRALRKLTAAATGYLNQAAALRTKTTDADEIAALERVAENANQIVEAGGRLGPAPVEDNKKKKKP